MKQSMQTFIQLLSKNEEEALLEYYLASSEPENVGQLAYMFNSAVNDISMFYSYQQLATKLIEKKGLAAALLAQIKTNDTLSFFTPALQSGDNFKKTDSLQRNALHYLFAGNPLNVSTPPFNYLRSMMLFESNETLRYALCQRDSQNLTPIEVYLFSNANLAELPPHELTALLALIEIESKQQAVDHTNYISTIDAVGDICRRQAQVINSELQRLILIAIYFTKPIKNIITTLG